MEREALSLRKDLWYAVVRAIETAMPDYDRVNEKVSLGLALRIRNHAADGLALGPGMTVLDAGIGPGTMSEVLLSKSNGFTIVGLDVSTILLGAARDRRSLRSSRDRIHLVRGVFEALPFRDGRFGRIVSAYAFRDSRDRTKAIAEFHRVAKNRGVFCVVDLGKPDARLKRAFVTVYVHYFAPMIALFFKTSAVEGNPWRAIFPTYEALDTNSKMAEHLRARFSEVRIEEFGLGAMVVICADKATS